MVTFELIKRQLIIVFFFFNALIVSYHYHPETILRHLVVKITINLRIPNGGICINDSESESSLNLKHNKIMRL